MKSLLALASLSAVLAATAAPVAAATNIVGTWLAVYNGGVHSAIAQWQEGGTAAQEPDLAPAGGNTLLGTWSARASGGFSLSLRGWTFGDTGNVTGYFTKTEVDRLREDGQGYAGRFQVTFFDLNGNVLFEQGGALIAHRLN